MTNLEMVLISSLVRGISESFMVVNIFVCSLSVIWSDDSLVHGDGDITLCSIEKIEENPKNKEQREGVIGRSHD